MPTPVTSAPPTPLTPLRTIDAWRGIAALWVVALHACLPVISARWPALQHVPLFAVSLRGQLGVTIFFVISGYCITSAALSARRKPSPIARFLTARVRRIYPPYAAATVLAIAAATVLEIAVRRGLLKGSSLASVDFFHHGPWYYVSAATLMQIPLRQTPVLTVFWSLSYEVAFYAVVAAIMLVTRRRSGADGLLWGLHAVTFVSLLWSTVDPASCPFPLDLWPQFGLGALACHVAVAPRASIVRLAFAAAIALELVYGWRQPGVQVIGKASTWDQALAASVFPLVILAGAAVDARVSRWAVTRAFAWVGSFSYSLYLTHLLALGAGSQLVARFGMTSSAFWLTFLVEIGVAVIFARVFFAFFERPFIGTKQPTPSIARTATPFWRIAGRADGAA